jgi:S1-C subfamily serine protease
MRSGRLLALKLGALLLAFCTVPSSATAQSRLSDHRCELIVEGRVARLYASPDGRELVELHLRSVSLEAGASVTQSVRLPAPGEVIYVVVETGNPRSSRLGITPQRIPATGDTIRAILRAGEQGKWMAEGDWFESRNTSASERDSDPIEDRFDRASALVEVLGMSCEATLVGGQLGLEVKQVATTGAAKEVGLQPGDIVIAIDGQPLTSAANLKDAVAGRPELKLTVIDVNTGRVATVTVKASPDKALKRVDSHETANTVDSGAVVGIAAALGIAVEPTRVGLRKALEVKAVQKNSPGAQAGLEAGDLIVKVGDRQVSSVSDLAATLPPLGGPLTLVVRDVRSDQEVPIEVNSAGFQEPQTADKVRREGNLDRGGPSGKLGITGELTFYEAEAAVKVVGVRPGSAADQAGITAGMILRSADGKPLLHPDDLAQIEQTAQGRVLFCIVDPASQRESTIKVQL